MAVAAVLEREWEPWLEVLQRRRRERAPWLVLPAEPHRTNEHRAVSYGALHRSAVRVAGALRARGVERGDRVVVLADNSAESALTLMGILALGAVMVPVAPPGMQLSLQSFHESLQKVCRDCTPRVVVTRKQPTSALGVAAQVVAFEELWNGVRAPIREAPDHRATDVALIQYTSGTTARPRGAALTYGNLRHNIWNIGVAFDAKPGEVGVTWLPLFHDMGLIGCLLFATAHGMSAVMMTPIAFLKSPASWLWAVSRFGAVCSAAPNSAYHRAAERPSEASLSGLELSRWRVAFNGAEHVHVDTVERFCDRFAKYGFRKEAMYPVYGLAENTVAATLPPHGRPLHVDIVDADGVDRDGRAISAGGGVAAARTRTRTMVGVGKPLRGQELRIADPDTGAVLAEREVGEIQLRGPCTMHGYWAAPDETARAFTSDGWLKTGDRGYVVRDELYVVGRYKHVVKRLGRTLDCGFIESAVVATGGVRGGVAVFGIPDQRHGTERLVILAEAAPEAIRDGDALQRVIAEAVQGVLSLTPDIVTLVPIGSIPRTTSGKVCHGDARRIYLDGGA